MEEVALSLSGGGFRAAMFHLGTLSYLNHLRLPDNRPFLEIVNTLSTISGGTITGLWYLINYCEGKETDGSLRELYSILTNCDLPVGLLDSYLEKGNRNASVIKEMIRQYDKVFFHERTFGLIMAKLEKGHIHHFSANGTDFSTGLAFRFQASRSIRNAMPEYKYGIIGNNTHRVPRDIAAQIRLSEILAVSSCFPGGFEPVVYPDDFSFFKDRTDTSDWPEGERFNLMDGGIVDNQGIEPLLLASQQMACDHPQAQGDKDYPCHDLIIISDVSSAKVKTQMPMGVSLFFPHWSFASIEKCLYIYMVITILLSIVSYMVGMTVLCVISVVLFFVGLLGRYGLHRIEKFIGQALRAHVPFSYNWRRLKQLDLSKLVPLVQTRLTSLLDLAKAVFMKPIRQMRYGSLYRNPKWKNRLISNIISELSNQGSWQRKGNFPQELIPSEEMKKNSDKACGMGTTLWFTESDKKEGVPEALFTTGQYTICMNLLEYIVKLENDSDNTTPAHELIRNCKAQLLSDWNEFQCNPQFLLHKVL